MESKKTDWSLAQWLTWLESCHPKKIDLGRERIRQVADRLKLLTQHIEPDITVVTVAGTNGKGSFVAALSALISHRNETQHDKNMRYGAYSSPHVFSYNERVCIDGVPVNDAEILEAFNHIEKARADISLTYFEFGTLAAFYLFKKYCCEIWILEVGLGGRLDAVNILDPTIAVITAIDLDHQQWLGETRELIGAEKAGILRPGISAIIADEDPPQSVLKKLQEQQCQSLFLSKDFLIDRTENSLVLSGKTHFLDGHAIDRFSLPENSLLAALQVDALLFNDQNGDETAEKKFFKHKLKLLERLKLTGRNQLEFVQGESYDIPIVFDVAHNPQSVARLAIQLQQHKKTLAKQTLIAVCAMMADKDSSNILKPLVPLVDAWMFSDIPGLPRAAKAGELARQLSASLSVPVKSRQHASPSAAFNSAIRVADRDSLVVVFGSFYIVSPILAALTQQIQ